MENEGQGQIDEAYMGDRLEELEQQGLVNSTLRTCYTLKEETDPRLFASLLHCFSHSVSVDLDRIMGVLKADVVDFTKLRILTIKLEGCVVSIGATRLREACTKLRRACDIESKEGCKQAFVEAHCEFGTLSAYLDIILELEQALLVSHTISQGSSVASAFSAP